MSRCWKRSLILWMVFRVASPAGGGLEIKTISVVDDSALPTALEAALDYREGGRSVALLLEPGVYRQPLHLVADPQSSAEMPPELTIRARIPGSVVFREGLKLDDWEKEDFRTWSHPLPGKTASEEGRVVLFYDGAWLNQKWDRASLNPWEYTVSREDDRIYLAVPEGTKMDSTRFMMAAKRASATLLVKRMRNLVLEGLVFEYDYAPGDPAVYATPHVVDSEAVVLRECSFLHNAVGLRVVDSHGIELIDCRFQYAGGQGLYFSRSGAVNITGISLTHNGVLEADAGPGFPFGHGLVVEDMRGTFRMHRGRVTDNRSGIYVRDSNGHTLHLEDLVLGYHEGYGVVVEGTPGFTTIRGCRIGRNGRAAVRVDFEPGHADAAELVLTNTILFGLEGAALLDVSTGAVQMRDCIVEQRAMDGGILRFSGQTTYRGEGNLFYHPETSSEAFNGTAFNRWVQDGDKEKDSHFADPLFLNTETLDFDMHFDSPWFRKEHWGIPESSQP